MGQSAEPPELPWHVVHGDTLMAMLRRCRDGEDPEMVYAEEYANSDRQDEVVAQDEDGLYDALKAALTELADDDLEDGTPVIVAWGVEQLARKLADMLVYEEPDDEADSRPQ